MRIKWLIRTADAVALGEDSEKKRAEYVERDSLPSIMSCLRRDDDVQSQSTSEAISLKDGLVSAKDPRGAAPDGRHSLEPTVPALIQGVRVQLLSTVSLTCSGEHGGREELFSHTVGNGRTRTP